MLYPAGLHEDLVLTKPLGFFLLNKLVLFFLEITQYCLNGDNRQVIDYN